MSRFSSSALRKLAAAAWSRSSGMLCELSTTSSSSTLEGEVQRVLTTATGGKAFPGSGMRLFSLSSSSSSSLNLLHRGHSSGPCSRCGSACRCAFCCSCCRSHVRRRMKTSAAATTATTSHQRSISFSVYSTSSPPISDVTVASMGESITEGTVAVVLKSPGDAVGADEVIAQIETDKVTIDVRSPFAGKIASLEVKEGESVVVGQVVAKVEEGAEGNAAVAAKPAAVEKEQHQDPAAAAAVAAAAAAPTVAPPRPASPPHPPLPRKQAPQRRKPSISFPARLTKAGVRISSLPASEAKAARAAIKAAELDGPELAERLSRGRPAGSNATIPLYVGTERGTKLSASRVLSDREMEMIELGGAAP